MTMRSTIVNKEAPHPALELAESASQATRDGILNLADSAADKGAKALLLSSVRRPITVLVLMVMDALALLAGFVLAGYLIDGGSRVREVVLFAPVLLAMWLVLFAACDLYGKGQERRELRAMFTAVLWGAGLLSIGSVVYPQAGFSLAEIVLGTLFIAVLEIGLRFSYERGTDLAYRRRLGLIPTLIVGEDEERSWVRQVMAEKPSATLAWESSG